MTSKASPLLTHAGNSVFVNNSLRRPDIYQTWLKRKYGEFEDAYWLEIDELYVKLRDKGESKNLPDFQLSEFAFIGEWLSGQKSSKYTFEVFETMDLQKVAETRICRRLTMYMIEHEEHADMCKYVLAGLKEKAVPLYLSYLNMLKKFFEVLARIDDSQIPITWLEQILPGEAKGEITTRMVEMPLNQFIHQMDSYIIGGVENKYYVGDNVAVFDESATNGTGRVIHWIFCPKSYLDVIKNLYKIKDVFNDQAEFNYLKKLIEGVK